MRRTFFPFFFLACFLLVLAPATAFPCPKHHAPCKQSQPRPLPPAAISVYVVETVSTIVYDYDFQWEWDVRAQQWVKRWFVVGWHTEWKTEERWVTAYWNDALGAFTYYDKNGKIQVVNR